LEAGDILFWFNYFHCLCWNL